MVLTLRALVVCLMVSVAGLLRRRHRSLVVVSLSAVKSAESALRHWKCFADGWLWKA